MSPFGPISINSSELGLRLILLGKAIGNDRSPINRKVVNYLVKYFNCEDVSIDFPIELPKFSPKTRLVYETITEIPFGKTITYGELARMVGTSPRAVGRILSANPLPIILPCHRIVASNGLGGFSAGIEWKIKLLRHERCL